MRVEWSSKVWIIVCLCRIETGMIFIHFRKIQHKGQYTFMANWWLGNLVCQLISTSNQSLCICLGHIPLAIFFHLQSESLNQWLIHDAVMQSKLTIQDFRYAFRSKFFLTSKSHVKQVDSIKNYIRFIYVPDQMSFKGHKNPWMSCILNA